MLVPFSQMQKLKGHMRNFMDAIWIRSSAPNPRINYLKEENKVSAVSK